MLELENPIEQTDHMLKVMRKPWATLQMVWFRKYKKEPITCKLVLNMMFYKTLKYLASAYYALWVVRKIRFMLKRWCIIAKYLGDWYSDDLIVVLKGQRWKIDVNRGLQLLAVLARYHKKKTSPRKIWPVCQRNEKEERNARNLGPCNVGKIGCMYVQNS